MLIESQVGQGRFQTAALIELREPLPTSEEGVKALKEGIWTSMNAANVEAPAHGQLHKEYVIFATEDKPFILAGKGTVLRAMTVQLYENEIKECYESQELQQSSEEAYIDVTDRQSIQEGIQILLRQVLHDEPLSTNDDFFMAGLDSLSVFKVLAGLRAALRSTQVDSRALKISVIYSNPTIEKLSRAIDLLLRPAPATHESVTTVQLMSELLEKYTLDLPTRPANGVITESGPFVILTGSTGSLGSYLLESLLANDEIQQVVCLNRTADAQERQVRSNNTRGLKEDLSSDRVKFLHADLSKVSFGLSDEDYNELLRKTTHIIRKSVASFRNLKLIVSRQSMAGRFQSESYLF